MSSDLSTGVIDRFRTLPMARSAILAGRTLVRPAGRACCAARIVLITGFVIGWRPDNGLLGVVAGLGVAVLFAYALSWFTACIGLRSNDPESAQAVGLLILFPLAFVSSCFVPTSGLPELAAADRRLEPGVGGGGRRAASCSATRTRPALVHNFPNQHPVLVSILWIAGILAVCVPLASRMLRARTVD